ncbi:MAG: MFS transporter [Gorillibacterium sp.]|nr:MFS transporter [Gorillibacterium sp.]
MQPLLEGETKPPHPLRNFTLPFTNSRTFPCLWLGQLVSVLGSSITTTILPLVVLSLTGSTLSAGLILSVYMLFIVLALPLSGFMVDRYDRIRLMLLSDLARFLIMAAAATFAFTDHISMGILYVLVGLYGLMDGIFHPAYAAVRAQVFTPDIRNAANAVSQLGNQGIRLMGPSIGGLLLTFASAGFGFGLDALTYAISFCCLGLLRRRLVNPFSKTAQPSPTNEANPEDSNTAASAIAASSDKPSTPSSSWKKDFTEGILILRSHPWLWITILAFSFINICFAGVTAVLIPWLFKIHHGFDPRLYGYAVTCSGVGAILAAAVFGSRPRWRHRGLLAYGGALLSGIALFTMTLVPSAAGLAALFTLEGFGIMIFGLIWETSLQELVPPEAFGRVASLDMLGSFALLPIGYILIGWLAEVIGGIPTIAIFSSIGIVTIIGILAVPAIRRFQ